MFRDQALHNEKCSFSIYGLFCVDRRLIAAVSIYYFGFAGSVILLTARLAQVLGSMVTYLATVVQFHILTHTLTNDATAQPYN